MPTTFTLPDFYADWPFQRTLNPYHEPASLASREWVESFHVLDSKAQDVFNRCKFSLLASLTYPRTDPAHLRVSCDLINWYFVFDELSDVSDGACAREMAARLMDILRDPLKHRPDQSILEKMTASFWSRSLEFAHPISAKRFVDSMEPYIEAVCQEAEDRDHRRVRSIEEYLALRRGTVGAEPSFYFLALSLDIPEEVMSHHCIDRLTRGAVDLIILSNDVYSWSIERVHGLDNHNMVSVVIAEKGLDIQGAVDYVGDWYHDVARKFVEDMNNVPSFSEAIDSAVSEYIFGIGNWVTGFLEWAFESERYFGPRGPEYKSSGIVELLPRRLREE